MSLMRRPSSAVLQNCAWMLQTTCNKVVGCLIQLQPPSANAQEERQLLLQADKDAALQQSYAAH